LAPEYLSSKFEGRETAYNLRDSDDKRIVQFLLTYNYKNSFSYSDTILWNSVPCDSREADFLRQFKHVLKRDL